jgi:hypothetical protein
MLRTVKGTEVREQAAIARIFTAAVFHEMVKKGQSPIFARLMKELAVEVDKYTWSVGRILDELFDLLKRKSFRNEYAYKTAVAQKVLLGSHSLRTASLVDEFRVGKNKADIVMLNGTSTAYEIKSDRDKLDRLYSQVVSYSEVFASVTVLCAERHLEAVVSIVPDFVGVSVLTDRYQISTFRKSFCDPSRTISSSIFKAITQREAIEVLKNLDVRVPSLPNTQMHSALDREFVKIPSTIVHDEMVRVLKSTRNLSGLSESVRSLPASIRFFALTVPLTERTKGNLLDAIDTPLMEALKWG